MMMDLFGDLWGAIISGISVFATGFVGWFFGRRKTKAEVRSAEIDNDVKLSKHYAKILDDLEQRYQQRFEDITVLFNQKEKMLKEEIRILKRRIKLLQSENRELRKHNKTLTDHLKGKE